MTSPEELLVEGSRAAVCTFRASSYLTLCSLCPPTVFHSYVICHFVKQHRLTEILNDLTVSPAVLLVRHVSQFKTFLIQHLKIYDYLLTFEREVSLIWCSPRSIVKTLFLLTRYTPFVGLSTMLYCTFSTTFSAFVTEIRTVTILRCILSHHVCGRVPSNYVPVAMYDLHPP